MTARPLIPAGYVDLPAHKAKGGFDHAAVHAASGRIYVAHTANDAVDVFDRRRYLFSIPNLPGIAGALVSDEADLVFTSNRGENTIGVFSPSTDPKVTKIAVGMRPNGLAYDAKRRLVLAANVGDPAVPHSYTLSMVDLDAGAMRASIEVPGRTRWTVFDADAEVFYVNIMHPSQIVVVDARKPDRVARTMPIPAEGAHGLDFDAAIGRLYCACDAGGLVTLEARSGKVLSQQKLSGVPDVVWFNPKRQQLYVAVGDPGVVDVFDTATMRRLGSVATEKGAHTTAFPPSGDTLIAFLPASHRAAIYHPVRRRNLMTQDPQRRAMVLGTAGAGVIGSTSGNAQAIRIDFERVPYMAALTGSGPPPHWTTVEDGGRKVLAETSKDTTDYRFPLAIFDQPVVADLEVAVRFKPVSGEVDRAAGLAVRLADANNYYVVRANAAEDNVRLYKVVAGQRRQFASANVKVPTGAWQELRLTARGSRFEVFLNGKSLYSATDTAFTAAGKVALWTKADSVTYFDDLRIQPL